MTRLARFAVAVIQQIGIDRSDSRHRADIVDRSKMTLNGPRAASVSPLGVTNGLCLRRAELVAARADESSAPSTCSPTSLTSSNAARQADAKCFAEVFQVHAYQLIGDVGNQVQEGMSSGNNKRSADNQRGRRGLSIWKMRSPFLH
jgi:hypothetical protein